MKNQKEQKQSIHIYQQGRKTIAQLNQGKEIIYMSSAICHPDDEYDFTIGSNISYERLMDKTIDKDIEDKLESKEVREVKRAAKTGEYIKALKDSEHYRYKKGDILLVTNDDLKYPWGACGVEYYSSIYKGFAIKNEDYVVLENYKGNKTFRPFLISTTNGKPSGISVDGEIGDDTSLVDIFGNQLKVGDTVYVLRKGYSTIREYVVCKKFVTAYISGYKNYIFVDGVENSSSKPSEYCIVKNQSYENIKNKTIIDGYMYITEDKEI